ncbi:MAG: FKBP-type peptidyl-prolyl cis-trans isomerase [Chitinophagaceae bacterium]|nr:FKBP-type peptidyl-prolyl cis-trans isomerase [Chitinophagaceae bacterium]
MNKYLIVLLAAVASLVACTNNSMKKTAGGMPYKLMRSKDTQSVYPGAYVKLYVTQKINDSVTMSTADGIPVYLFVSNTNIQKYDVSELWTSLHRGDSVTMTQMMDTFIKRAPQSIPPQFKNGDRIITSLRVLEVFPSDSVAKADEDKERKNFTATEGLKIEKYLAEKKITAQKTPSGAYVSITKEGIGNTVDSGKWISVKYTGTSWSGRKFDSNTDSSFHHMEPMNFVLGVQPMIKGFDEGLFFFKKGSVGRIYVPSMLGYGPSPSSPNIKPYEALIFDLEVLDVQDKAPVVAPPPPPPPAPKK